MWWVRVEGEAESETQKGVGANHTGRTTGLCSDHEASVLIGSHLDLSSIPLAAVMRVDFRGQKLRQGESLKKSIVTMWVGESGCSGRDGGGRHWSLDVF